MALFGAGAYGRLCISYMRQNNYNVVCFIDNDKNKQNTFIENIPVISLNDIFEYDIVLITSFSINIIDEILEYKINKPIISFNKWFTIKNIKEFINISNILYDNESKKVLKNILLSKINNDNNLLYEIYDNQQYFSIPNFHYSFPNEIFIDIGAFVGDTLEKFINIYYGIFNKIYAFEPGTKQFNALKTRVDRLIKEWALNENSIILKKCGVSNYNGESYFNENSQIAINSITNSINNNKINIVSIDSTLLNEHITFIKADIEGEELNMLKGAKNTIKKYKPKIAISVYHRPDDLLTIPKYIKSIVPEYKFSLRHHSITFNETVLYCWTRPDQTRPDQTRPDQTRPDLIFTYVAITYYFIIIQNIRNYNLHCNT
ncbi:FkbM family methyltransferase [Brachyspira hyodysenteriae]|uniref:FkbM family methyltransferase n=1 Tax=Brachyspira hyodysenteriae TaxID=159 RepID=UPI0022CDBB16|nr:FkbM family methyltransferase [Brachyspira hyodysenteriae]